MQLGTFTVDVTVDGKVLQEYDVVSESPTKVTCWIASEEGKPFSVKWTCHELFRLTGFQPRLFVDGLGCVAACAPPGRFGVNSSAVFSHFVNVTTIRELMFARVQLSDDDSLLNKTVSKHSGEIQLTIQRGNVVMERINLSKMDVPVPDDSKFHERTKKATVHCLGFGPEISKPHPSCIPRLIPNGEPMLTFVFKYRPLSVLQADGVAPKLTPKGASAVRELSSSERDVTPEDIKPDGLNERIRNLENELKRLRDLQDGVSEERKPKRIKREEQIKREAQEIIDLT